MNVVDLTVCAEPGYHTSLASDCLSIGSPLGVRLGEIAHREATPDFPERLLQLFCGKRARAPPVGRPELFQTHILWKNIMVESKTKNSTRARSCGEDCIIIIDDTKRRSIPQGDPIDQIFSYAGLHKRAAIRDIYEGIYTRPAALAC